MYQLVNGVEKCVIKMTDEEVRKMLEDSGVKWRQLVAASKARVLNTKGDKVFLKKNLLLFLDGSDEGKQQ